MSYSASSIYSSALGNSWAVPGGQPVIEAGGTFQPRLNEQIALARSTADEQFDNTFLEQFRGQMQNRLTFLQGQLQQAYTALLSATSAAMVQDNLAAGDNKFLYSESRGNGYQNYTQAFSHIGNTADGAALTDVDGDGKKEIVENGGKFTSLPTYSDSFSGTTSVRARAMTAYGAALDIKQKVGITMRSEEFNDPALGFMTPGMNYKVKEYETQFSTGAYWAGVNYLYAWRPSELEYTYVDAYSQNSDAAGFEGYLADGNKTRSGDKGDGSLTNQNNPDAVKWQGAGYAEGYLATYASMSAYGDKYSGSSDTDPGASDVGTNGNIGGDDDLRFANTYYARTRTISVDPATWDLATYSYAGTGKANADDGIITVKGTEVINNHDDGVGLFDVVNGNAYFDKNGNAVLPGSGKIDETFNSSFLNRQMTINYYNGQAVNGNADNPIFGNMELARFQTYWDPDANRNVNEDLNGNGILDAGEDTDGNGFLTQYLNGVDISAEEADKNMRLGQVRQFVGPTGNPITQVDPRPQDQNSLASYILEIMRKPMYKDIFRLGLFKDVVLNGAATSPAGGVVNGTIRLTYLMTPDPDQGRVIPGQGWKPGLRGQMVVFQDKFTAKA